VPTFSSNFAAILEIAGTAGGGTLAAVLAAGNTTGGTDIVISSGDAIDAANNGAGAGFELQIIGSDGGGGLFVGGNVRITPGQGSGGGADGEVIVDGDGTVTGDLTVTGSFVYDLIFRGTGTPEGAVVAAVGAVYQRLDGAAGNTMYLKQSGGGLNTGWVPAGPTITEEFTAVGAAAFTTARNFFQNTGVNLRLFVTWNGVRQREGGGNDFTVTAANQITFAVSPPPGDIIAIEYLPL
jgi:hypothetical protein